MERIWHKKRIWTLAIILLFAILLSSGCGDRQIENGNMGETAEISIEEETVENTTNISTGQEDTVKDISVLKLLLNDEEINVRWEDNEAVQALHELVAKESVTISMSMYGGFEQVGEVHEIAHLTHEIVPMSIIGFLT